MFHLSDNLYKIKGRRFIVVGDIGLDEYISGKVSRISPEAPIPIVKVENSSQFKLGLSANVAKNIVSLGGEVALISVVGQDQEAEQIKSLISGSKIQSYFVIDNHRPTTKKIRIMSGQHHIARLDYENQNYISDDIEKKIIELFGFIVNDYDGVIIQDYGKGVISKNCAQKIITLAKKASKKVFVDPYSSTPLSYYKGSYIMTPNHDEAIALAGNHSGSFKEIKETICKAIQSDNLIITLGEDGMHLFQKDKILTIPTFAQTVFDVTGAGDTVIAALATAHISGFNLTDSCLIANHAAGVVVGKVGCASCSFDELLNAIKNNKG